MLDAGRPSLPRIEDPDALMKWLRQKLPEIMAEARAYRVLRRRERDEFEERYGPIPAL